VILRYYRATVYGKSVFYTAYFREDVDFFRFPLGDFAREKREDFIFQLSPFRIKRLNNALDVFVCYNGVKKLNFPEAITRGERAFNVFYNQKSFFVCFHFHKASVFSK
jgi:hypothetical protein